MIILKRMRIMKIILATNENKYYSYSLAGNGSCSATRQNWFI